MKIIEIIVTPDGQTQVETKGFAGGECRAASQILELALGQTMKEQLTPEFYSTSSGQQTLNADRG